MTRLHELQIRFAHHAAVAAPDAMGPTITPFHRGDNLLPRRHVVAVAGEDFVAQRDPLPGHDQTDADLFAVGPPVAGVTALGLRVALAKPLEVGARHVVQQQIVIQVKEHAEAAFQVRLQSLFVRKQLIQGAV